MSMRISGLASGLDTDTIISEMMRAQRMKVDKVKQNKTLIEWRQESLNEINKMWANFILDTKKELGLTMTTATGTILQTSVSSLNWVKKATLSDTEVADVKAYANAVHGNYEINVRQLAENWSAASSAAVSVGDKSNLASQFGLEATDTINFTITTGSGSVTINKTNLAQVSISSIVNEINKANIGVTATYDATADRFFIQTKNTGSAGTIKITDNSTLSSGQKFITGSGSALKLQYMAASATDPDGPKEAFEVADDTVYAGQDAIIDFGAATGITQSSNTFTINEIGFTLKQTGKVNLTVATDTGSVYDKISAFVDKYNELIDKLNAELSEKRYSDYRPLTDEQREAMTDKQIELWEEKAKSGLLRGNMKIEQTLQAVRTGFYEEVQGVKGIFDQLTEIGITTEVYSTGSRGGKLVINRTELTEAIEKDVDSVIELLFKQPSGALSTKNEDSMTAAEIKQKRSESGLIGRLYDNLVAGMKEIIIEAGVGDNAALYRNVNSLMLIEFVTEYSSISMMDKDISGLSDRIDTLNEYLMKTETRLYNQFTVMEQYIQRMNEQSSWLASQLGTNSGR